MAEFYKQRAEQPLYLIPSLVIAGVNLLAFVLLFLLAPLSFVNISAISFVIAIIAGAVFLYLENRKKNQKFITKQIFLFLVGWIGCAAIEIILLTTWPTLPFVPAFSLGIKVIFSILFLVANIVWRQCCIKIPQIADYLLWGTFAAIISFGTFSIFYYIVRWDEMGAQVISWIFAVIFAFITNKIFVFDKKSSDIKGWIREFVQFASGRLLTGVIFEIALFWLLTSLMNVNVLGSKVIVTVIVVIANYFWSKFVAFKNPMIID